MSQRMGWRYFDQFFPMEPMGFTVRAIDIIRKALTHSLVLVLSAILGSTSAYAMTIESATSGAWNQTSTWVGSVILGTTDDITIKTGHTVSQNDSRSCKTLTIEATATFNLISTLAQSILFLNQGTVAWTSGNITDTGNATNDGTFALTSMVLMPFSHNSLLNAD